MDQKSDPYVVVVALPEKESLKNLIVSDCTVAFYFRGVL
ncbi:hypothetical protein DES49_1286 [Halospina denitrificans]|uniref:Uncharacterized protein n=1 Tax=Halospina denitrificans TaxID=332522 RepID=A0A4R7K1T7_9GAMM|nr:hypothetical protein DES49_1286 [Halospina denitrificans]